MKILSQIKEMVVVGVFIAAVIIWLSVNYKNNDFIKAEEWIYFPGAEVSSVGVHFKPLNRNIVHSDGSVGQLNPPIKLNGQHFGVNGDFKITATMQDIDKQASFRLYSSPVIIYDEWRYEPPSIDIGIDTISGFVTVRIWDGKSSNSVDMRVYKVVVGSKTEIKLEHIKDQFNIVANDRILGNIPDHNIFSSGIIWFGADSSIYGTGWTLSKLSIDGIGNGKVRIINSLPLVGVNDPNGLQNLANTNFRKIKIGSAVALSPLVTDEQYKNLALSQFGIITPENSFKPQFIHPAQGVYDFAESDQLVDIALNNSMYVHGHFLVNDKSIPIWMTDSLKEERQKIMVDHIKNVVGHFKGKVAEWDVVNEAFSKKNALYRNWGSGLEPNIWFEAMGEEYIDIAFKAAHEADPYAKLYLNDYGVERDGQRWDALLRLVERLKQRGVPIDGVGFEAHVYSDGDYMDAKQLKGHMDILAGLGLSVRISEIDVTGDDPVEQVNQYVTALDVCLKAPNCTSYTTWGITDLYGSTTRSDRYPLVYGTSLLWDKEMKSKPAFSALQNRLKEFSK